MTEAFSLTDQDRKRVEAFRARHKTGVLALLFTDMVDSTKLKQDLGDAAGTALIGQQQETVREILTKFSEAEEIKTAGDSFFITFIRPSDAVRFALLLQNELRKVSETTTSAILLRIGIHLGEVFVQQQNGEKRDILGIQADMAARVMGLANAGQILLTRSVFDNARAILRGEEIGNLQVLSWLNHGPYRMKGVDEAVDICEVGEEALAPLSPPPDTEKGHRYISPDQEPVLGWRPALDLEIPTSAGWILTEKLGEGGFGEVWRARHKALKETRVFKFCFRADRVRSLKREVTLFRLLKENVGEHPNIVRIHEVYFDEPPFYIGMEDVAGKNLIEWCEEQGGADKIPEATKLEIVAQVADALQAAHDSGIIHRDVKPSNILVDGPPEDPSRIHAKLTDFGIGQVVSKEVLTGKTAAGFTETLPQSEYSPHAGTRIYMAPEVLAGANTAPASDGYSLGVVLFQILLGDFRQSVTIDWRESIGDPILESDLALCLSGNPLDRFTQAHQFAENLRTVPMRRDQLEREKSRSRASKRRQNIRNAASATALIALLLFLAFAYFHRKTLQQREIDRQQKQEILVREYESTIQKAYACVKEKSFQRARDLLASCPSQLQNWEWGWLTNSASSASLILQHKNPAEIISFNQQRGIITTDSGEAIHIWNSKTGTLIESITNPHFVAYNSGATSHDYREVLVSSPNNKYLAHVESSGKCNIWDLADGQFLCSCTINSCSYLLEAFINNTADYLLTCSCTEVISSSKRLDIQRIGSSSESFSFTIEADKGRSTWGNWRIAPDGASILCYRNRPRQACIYDCWTGEQRFSLSGTKASTVQLNEDWSTLAYITQENELTVLDLRSGNLLLSIPDYHSDFHFLGNEYLALTRSIMNQASNNAIRFSHVLEVFRISSASLVLSTEDVNTDGIITNHAYNALVTWHDTGAVNIWNLTSGIRWFSFPQQLGVYVKPILSSDGRMLAAVTSNDVVQVYNIEEKRMACSLQVDSSNVAGVYFSNGGQLLAAVKADNTATIWRMDSGRKVSSLVGHSNDITNIAFGEKGRTVCTTSADCTAMIWDVTREEPLRTAIVSSTSSEVLRFGRWCEPSFLTHNLESNMIELCNISQESCEVLAEAQRKEDAASLLRTTYYSYRYRDTVAFSPAERYVAIVCVDGVLRVWDLENEHRICKTFEVGIPMSSVLFGPTENKILVAKEVKGERGSVMTHDILCDIETGEIGDAPDATAVFYSDHNIVDASPLMCMTGNGLDSLNLNPRNLLAVSQDKRKFAVRMRDEDIRIVDLDRRDKNLPSFNRDIGAAAFCPDGSRLVIGLVEPRPDTTPRGMAFERRIPTRGQVKIWNTLRNTEVLSFDHDFGVIKSIEFSPDGKRVAVVSSDRVSLLTASDWGP